MKLKLQANISSRETNLEDTNHRCLDLILIDAEHNCVNRTVVFILPTYSRPLLVLSPAITIKDLQIKDGNYKAR